LKTIGLSINLDKNVHYALKKLALEKGVTMTKLLIPEILALIERESKTTNKQEN